MLDDLSRAELLDVRQALTLCFAEAIAEVDAALGAEAPLATAAPAPAPAPPTLARAAAVAGGFTGDACDVCLAFAMRRSGTCLTCTVCGSTTGCS